MLIQSPGSQTASRVHSDPGPCQMQSNWCSCSPDHQTQLTSAGSSLCRPGELGRTWDQLLSGRGVHCGSLPCLKPQGPTCEHISFPRLLNKVKGDDFLSPTLNEIILFCLCVVFPFLSLAFKAPTSRDDLSYRSPARFDYPARMNSVPPLRPLLTMEGSPTSLSPIQGFCILQISTTVLHLQEASPGQQANIR